MRKYDEMLEEWMEEGEDDRRRLEICVNRKSVEEGVVLQADNDFRTITHSVVVGNLS